MQSKLFKILLMAAILCPSAVWATSQCEKLKTMVECHKKCKWPIEKGKKCDTSVDKKIKKYMKCVRKC